MKLVFELDITKFSEELEEAKNYVNNSPGLLSGNKPLIFVFKQPS